MAEIRLRFTPADLVRTRVRLEADLRWETALSLDRLRSPEHLPRSPEPAPESAAWRSWARPRLGPWIGPLLAAAGPAERFPAFLDRLREDEHGPSAALLQRYHTEIIAPWWPAISAAVAADRAGRARTLAEAGLEGLLRRLTPTSRWQAPVLELPHPVDLDLDLAGRGLLLVPTYFGSAQPVVVDPPAGPVVLVHPIAAPARRPLRPAESPARRSPGIDALLGSTRAAVLQALSDGCTTTELAERVGVSAATASQHATVLRGAGLISTRRRGPAVLHVVTDLGSAVLRTSGSEARGPRALVGPPGRAAHGGRR